MRDTHVCRQQLRAATACEHERVDALFPGGLVDATAYRCYLQGMHRLCDDVAKGWLRIARAPEEPLHRVSLLQADLARLALDALPAAAPLALDGELELAGAEYVIQGSRMGARLLSRQARRLGRDGPDNGAAFLTWHSRPEGQATWEALLERIARLVRTNADEDRLMAAAVRTFSAAAFAFEHARQRVVAQ
ncbi:MAG: biliverdin-producing heme oxygenase [Pseudoxanthomonas suwonensis]|nr:biliverdin-producing heme oxygenase [Pseudoxanthomonas suwonensis]